MDERIIVRKKIRSPARNLADQIVKITEDYRGELNLLERDNRELQREIIYRKELNNGMIVKNKALCNEISHLHNRINEIFDYFGKDKKCYLCLHEFSCENPSLCCYCKKWMCRCCIDWCRGINGNNPLCSNKMCVECIREHTLICPEHNNIENKDELMEYYKENRYDYPYRKR